MLRQRLRNAVLAAVLTWPYVLGAGVLLAMATTKLQAQQGGPLDFVLGFVAIVLLLVSVPLAISLPWLMLTGENAQANGVARYYLGLLRLLGLRIDQ